MKVLLSGQIPMGEHTVDVHIESTVYDLKTEIEDKIGLPRWLLILYTQMGKALEDDEYLYMYTYNGVVHLVVKRTDTAPRGGVKVKRSRGDDSACSKCGRRFMNTGALQQHWSRCTIPQLSISASLLRGLATNDDESSQDHEDNDGKAEDMLNDTRTPLVDDWLAEYADVPPDLPEARVEWDEEGVLWDDTVDILRQGQPLARYEQVISVACDGKTDLLVTNQLMDNLNFAEVAIKCGFTRRESKDVIDFIKNADTDLSRLQHPRSTIMKAKKTFGEVEWLKERIELTDGKTMGLSEDAWSFDVEFRSLGSAIREVLEAVGSRDTVKLRAENSTNGISEACHSDKFKRTQSFLFPDIKECDFPVQLVLFIDDSHCDVQGNLVACPVMMTLANFTLETMVLDEAKTIIMYIPVITSSIAEKGEGMSRIKTAINDRCLDIIFRQVEATQNEPLALVPFDDDMIYYAKVAVHCFANDTKAANELLHHSLGWNCKRPCRICLIFFDDLLKDPVTGLFRTTEEDAALRLRANKEELKRYSIKGRYCSFAAHPRAMGHTNGKGKSIMFPPDVLHTHEGGEQKIAVRASFAQIPKKRRKELDQKIRRMSPGLGRLSRFTDNVRPFWGGCSNASRMKSTDYHKLALVVAIALVDDRGIVPDGRKRNRIIRGLLGKLQLRHQLKKRHLRRSDITKLQEALKLEREFHRRAFRALIPSGDRYPKRHLQYHYPFFIKELGPLRVFDTGHFEHGHITWVKKPSRATQRQMRKLFQQLTDLAKEQGMLKRALKMARKSHAALNGMKSSENDGNVIFTRDRVYGEAFIVDAGTWNGQGAALFTDTGKLSIEVLNLQADGQFEAAEAVGVLCSNGRISCQPSCTLKNDGESTTVHASAKIRDWVNVEFEGEGLGSTLVIPSQLMAFFTVQVKGQKLIYAIVQCLDTTKMKIRNLLRFQESNLAEDIFVIARQSIVSISLVIENPNKASSWYVLPADDDFPNYLGVAEGSESCLEDDSGSEHGDEDDSEGTEDSEESDYLHIEMSEEEWGSDSDSS